MRNATLTPPCRRAILAAALGIPAAGGVWGDAMAETDADAEKPDPVARLRWKARIILLCAPRGDDPALRDQLRRLDARWVALRDREMQVIRVDADLARRYGMDPARFDAALVGKDGEVKERWAEPRDPAGLLDTVDAMPMRRNEIRDGAPR